jgi:hypothetical protein
MLVCSVSLLSLPASARRQAHGTASGSKARLTTAKNQMAPDIKPRALWDGRKAVDFHALDFPKMVSAAQAHFLADDEYVLGLTVNGESRAYPTRIMAWHHIVNDQIGKPEAGGKAFVTVTY